METQHSVNKWADETFGKSPDLSATYRRVVEEMVEFTDAGNYQELMDEAADVVITLYRLASAIGEDLHAAIDRKMAKNRSRTWIIYGDGTGRHI